MSEKNLYSDTAVFLGFALLIEGVALRDFLAMTDEQRRQWNEQKSALGADQLGAATAELASLLA